MSLRGFCIAERQDGRICGRHATNIDPERGGVVCDEHRPSDPGTHSRRSPPSDETDAFLLTVKDAFDLAAEGNAADGFERLLAGFRRAEELRHAGEPFGAELAARWRGALDLLVEVYRIGRT
jgi:hypothetical protein